DIKLGQKAHDVDVESGFQPYGTIHLLFVKGRIVPKTVIEERVGPQTLDVQQRSCRNVGIPDGKRVVYRRGIELLKPRYRMPSWRRNPVAEHIVLCLLLYAGVLPCTIGPQRVMLCQSRKIQQPVN